MSGHRPLRAALLGALALLLGLPLPAAAALPRQHLPAGESARGDVVRQGAAAGEAPALAASSIVPGSVNRTSLAVRATYDVDVRYRVAARALAGRVTITARNRSGGSIDRLELNTVMAPLGGLRLGTVTVDGRAVDASISGQTITVPLGGVLPHDATAIVVLPFSATLRSSTTGSGWLFTRANGITNLYRWIPWVSRRHPFERPNHGDPFVTPVSPRVTLRLRTDRPLRIATTGTRRVSADGLVTTVTAEQVRDLVLTAAPDYRTVRATVGDTIVRVVTRPGGPAAALLSAARTALSRIEARLGPYPYRVLTVAQTAGGYGMEGPGVVWIPTGVAASNLPYLVTHEVAHQWFYALVGNDQAMQPFADEAAADMVTRHALRMRRASRCAPAALDRSIYRYSAGCYYEVVYIQGGNLLDDARRRMGGPAYWSALRGYLDAHRWGLAGTRTLLDALDAATPLDLASGWRARFPSLYP